MSSVNDDHPRNGFFKQLGFALLCVISALPAFAKVERDPHQRAEFMKHHPCPSTGKKHGACPGYVVDHIRPLCAGGADHPSNMQWQTKEDAKKKDREEKRACRH